MDPIKNTTVIPFGKYKDRFIEEVMATDPQYCEWLSQQAWFMDKFRPIYNIIIQAAPPSENTPEHNLLQEKFMNDVFCLRLARKIQPTISGKIHTRKIEDVTDVIFNVGDGGYYDYQFLIEIKPSIGDDYPVVLRQMKDQIRRAIQIRLSMANMRNRHPDSAIDTYMMRRTHILVYKQFTVSNLTLEQVKAIFKEAKIEMINFDEI